MKPKDSKKAKWAVLSWDTVCFSILREMKFGFFLFSNFYLDQPWEFKDEFRIE